MTQKLLVIIIAAFLNATYLDKIDFFDSDDPDIFIYGKVITEDDEVYTGQIRWGKEEAFWFDFFNSSKTKNENLEYLSKEELRNIRNRDRYFGDNFVFGLFGRDNVNRGYDNNHLFACQFGNIKTIEMRGGSKVEVEFKDGKKLKLKGGSNDIETYIQVSDKEKGHSKIKWNRIARVEFLKASGTIDSHYGNPLYGTVKTESGSSFTGYIQWDHDERLADDELNGSGKDGDIDIAFGKISRIEKVSRGAHITTLSGRSITLRGSNDVNNENRGIIVNMPGQGRVDIPWDEFEEVTFTKPKTGLIDYDHFDGHREITGIVRTSDGNNYKGRIIFDLDEELQLEILNGKKDDIEYFIPFSVISSISPLGSDEAQIKLKSGKSIELEDSVDVSDENDGVLVFENERDDPVYVSWKDIKVITL